MLVNNKILLTCPLFECWFVVQRLGSHQFFELLPLLDLLECPTKSILLTAPKLLWRASKKGFFKKHKLYLQKLIEIYRNETVLNTRLNYTNEQ